MSCKDCDWSIRYDGELECRFNPPVIAGEYDYTAFPKVQRDWWCSKDTTNNNNDSDDDSEDDVSEEEAMELIGDVLDDLF